MTDRPIIFSGPMVNALLDGRKTQTRRVLKLAGRKPEYIGPRGCQDDPTCWGWDDASGGYITVEGDDKDHLPGWRNGWRDWAGAYAPGDRLWVREAHSFQERAEGECLYRATVKDDTGYYPEEIAEILWRPSIHMPRWASRLTLHVTEVRVQRLQEISEADAIAEGCREGHVVDEISGITEGWSARTSFRTLWNSIHGPDAWDANPWVCAVSFTVERANIDNAGAA